MMLNYIFCYIIAVNVVTFVVFGIDKLNAMRGKWRIAEAVLLMLAFFGGSVGAWIGIGCWHHKTLHRKFRYGVPMIILFQIIVCCYLLREYIQEYISSF